MKKLSVKRLVIVIVLAFVWIFGSLYFSIPEINVKNLGFVFWAALTAVIIYLAIRIFALRDRVVDVTHNHSQTSPYSVHFAGSGKRIFKPAIIVAAAVAVYFLAAAVSSAMILRAGSYAQQMPLEKLDVEAFGQKITPESIGTTSSLPIIDKEISQRMAEGKLSTYGSQFRLSDSFTLIHIKENGVQRLVRVAPLEYSGFFVALNRYHEGSVGYVMVDVVSEEAKLVEVEGGMPYMESALLNKNLHRYIWMHYPTALIADYNFEVDDNGNPYWVASEYDYRVGLTGGADPVGAILVNASTGEIHRYTMDEVPEWVDRVVPVNIAYNQADNALTYQNGWFNAKIGEKRDVFQLTNEYNFISLEDRTYLYSGVTSANGTDQTSVGFVLVDLKTKEASMYSIQGITENRAKEIAQSHQKVKAQNLTATDPILINMEGEPTYFLTLKNGYQRQWYVLIRVSDGIIALNEDFSSAKTEYISLISGEVKPGEEEETLEVTGVVSRVHYNQSNDMVEFILKGQRDKLYSAPITLSTSVRFLQPDDEVAIRYIESGDGTALVRSITNQSIE